MQGSNKKGPLPQPSEHGVHRGNFHKVWNVCFVQVFLQHQRKILSDMVHLVSMFRGKKKLVVQNSKDQFLRQKKWSASKIAVWVYWLWFSCNSLEHLHNGASFRWFQVFPFGHENRNSPNLPRCSKWTLGSTFLSDAYPGGKHLLMVTPATAEQRTVGIVIHQDVPIPGETTIWKDILKKCYSWSPSNFLTPLVGGSIY